MSESDNTKLAKTLFDNINAHALDKNDALTAADAKTEAPGAPAMTTREQAKAYNQGFITAFPDLHFDVRLTVAQGDNVVVNWVGTGTHTGPLTTPSGAKVPPTGKKATVPGSTTLEIKGGKATRQWIHWDMASLLGQLGLMPPM
jgi:predicted ester cyclase